MLLSGLATWPTPDHTMEHYHIIQMSLCGSFHQHISTRGWPSMFRASSWSQWMLLCLRRLQSSASWLWQTLANAPVWPHQKQHPVMDEKPMKTWSCIKTTRPIVSQQIKYTWSMKCSVTCNNHAWTPACSILMHVTYLPSICILLSVGCSLIFQEF